MFLYYRQVSPMEEWRIQFILSLHQPSYLRQVQIHFRGITSFFFFFFKVELKPYLEGSYEMPLLTLYWTEIGSREC